MTDIPTITQEEAVEVRALKPCPFCGGEAALEHSYHEDDNRYPRDFWHVRITCGACGLADTGWSSYGNQEQKIANFHIKEAAEKQAAAAWNTRAALSPNMDHAVGGVRERAAIRDYLLACSAEADRQRLNMLGAGNKLTARDCKSEAKAYANAAAMIEREDHASYRAAALATPPVNQDAVRDAVALLANAETAYRIFCEAREAMNAARPDVMGTLAERRLYDERQIADVEAQREHHRTAILLAQGASQVLYSFRALATPPLDNTGLDAATVERCIEAVREVLYPKNPESDWTEFASVRAGCFIAAEFEMRSLLAPGDRS